MKNQELENMTRDELYEMARQKNIPGKSDMSKEELIQALAKSGSGQQSRSSSGREETSKAGHGGGKGDKSSPKGASKEEYKNIPGNQT